LSARALYAGSFDPVTVGHVDLVLRALPLFDAVLVAVGHHPAKRYWFDTHARAAMFRQAIADAGMERGADVSRVEVVTFEGLTVRAAAEHGATVLLRGLRGSGDMDLELRNAAGNRDLSGIETIWLPSDPSLSFVSSSLVREIAGHGGDVGRYVPAVVQDALAVHPNVVAARTA
jgi:pantetheine-phosphate adenylyltransferase